MASDSPWSGLTVWPLHVSDLFGLAVCGHVAGKEKDGGAIYGETCISA